MFSCVVEGVLPVTIDVGTSCVDSVGEDEFVEDEVTMEVVLVSIETEVVVLSISVVVDWTGKVVVVTGGW